MEQNIASMSKKVWNVVRVAIFMIRKGLCKKKIFLDLNMLMKRGKLAGKALGNVMFHHHHNNHDLFASRGGVGLHFNAREYEFSCSNTPEYRHFFTNKRKNHHTSAQYYMPSPFPLEESDYVNFEEVNNVLEMILRNGQVSGGSLAASPILPGLGFGRSPMARQLRITDSPFPVQNVEDNKHVDQAAEDFINNFYSLLKQQN